LVFYDRNTETQSIIRKLKVYHSEPESESLSGTMWWRILQNSQEWSSKLLSLSVFYLVVPSWHVQLKCTPIIASFW